MLHQGQHFLVACYIQEGYHCFGGVLHTVGVRSTFLEACYTRGSTFWRRAIYIKGSTFLEACCTRGLTFLEACYTRDFTFMEACYVQ